MSLRVIAGKAKGRKLKSVEGDTTRPITDRVKESLFNILGADVLDSNWWDLFGGTGAVGIEALSRGASFVRFTDMNREPIETIKYNLEHCTFESQAEVRRADAFAYLAAKPDRKFEYIYIAPPQLQPGARVLVPCGFAIAIPRGYEGQVRPRSGLALRSGVSIPNAPGTIDSDYRGGSAS